MQLIGIRLYDGLPDVIHNLNKEWYPFGRYDEPTNGERVPMLSTQTYNRLYQLVADNRLSGIEISMSCIVGKNGSGKSTLIDLYFRIINNLSYVLIEKKWRQGKIRNKGCNLRWAGGFDARLYFETDGKVGYIECRDDKLTMVYDGKVVDLEAAKDSSDLNDVLSKLFYTICINYSIFSFSADDYECDNPEHADKVDGKWLRGIMHKNDGYLTPIVIHPYREEDGTIDMGREKDLVKQRLATLSILFHAQEYSFLDTYTPKRIEYRIDTGAKADYQRRFEKLQKDWLPKQDVHSLHKGFYDAWMEQLKNMGLDEDMLETALSYLCYKSLKTCLYYQSYGALMGARLLPESESFRYRNTSGVQERMVFDKPDYFAVVDQIVEEPVSHITLKIKQLLTCLQNGAYKYDVPLTPKRKVDQYDIPINDVEKRLLQVKPNPKSWTYNDVYLQLPPAIFEWDICMTKSADENEPEVSLNKLSSGEKQKLQSASAILYHLNNLQGVVGDEYRVPYHHVNIIMDEAELYYHPEYQRKLITDILQMLAWCHIDAARIRSVNILLATHSPFVLSDVDKNKVLYLDKGNRKDIADPVFAANIHELLRKQFFLEHTMGNVSYQVIQKIVDIHGRIDKLTVQEKEQYIKQANNYRSFVAEISEPYIHRSLETMLVDLDRAMQTADSGLSWIDAEITRLQQWKERYNDSHAEDRLQ